MRLPNLPAACGVYIFKDINEKPIYIGKALNIKKRVGNQLDKRSIDPKSEILRKRAVSVEAIQVDSEIESLILEANLIKKFRPLLNSQLKDDKDYLYIRITKDTFPKIVASRGRNLKDAKIYFGPFPSAKKVRSALKTLRKIFAFSTCTPNQKRPCFYYHIGLCPGVCAGKVSEKEYKKNIKSLIYFLQGKKAKVFERFDKELKILTKNLQFEEAAQIREQLEGLQYTTKPVRVIGLFEEDLEEARNVELSTLASIVGASERLKRIECYDISNIFGKQATGSMAVFTNGLADKGGYRRFKIKSVSGINDVAMISEILERRFGHEWGRPNLIVIDGGRGQLNTAIKVLRKLGLDIPVVSLAKRLEEIYLPDRKKPIRLSYDNNALKLLQRIRDEAHRFAIAYHHKLRNKQFLTTN